MLRNYFLIGIRNLFRHKLSTFINVIGLAFGLAAFLLINEYVRFERSFDSYFANVDNIYRTGTLYMINDSIVDVKDANAYSLSAKVLYDELPEVINHTTTFKFDGLTLRKGNDPFHEKNVVTADTNFLDIFTHKVLLGSKKDMFKKPYSLVLTESKAAFYFGDENPVGKTIDVLGNYKRPFVVTGVIADVPDNTNYKFDILVSHLTITDRWDYGSWNSNNYYGFVVLDERANHKDLWPKLVQVSKKYLGEDTNDVFDLYPIQDIHLKSDYIYEPGVIGNERAVTFMSVISIFILLIAWVNYINLSTARAVQRAREVGLRKAIGAVKGQLIFQFLFESLLINFIAAILAFLIAELFLPYYNNLIGTTLTQHLWEHPSFIKNLFIFFLIGTFISGFYPALVLSGFKPAVVLKGSFSSSAKGVLLRKGLVIVQFVASLVLIAGTLIISKQLRFMREKDIGLDIDYVVGIVLPEVTLENQDTRNNLVDAFMAEIRTHPSVAVVGATTNLPGGDATDTNTTTQKVQIVGITEATEGITYFVFVDDQYTKAVGMKMAAGRSFDWSIEDRFSSIMVNEAFLRKLKISDPDSVINEYLVMGDNPGNHKYKIVGVVKDYNRLSLKLPVEPTVFSPTSMPINLVVKFHPDKYREGMQFLEAKWAEFFPDYALDYSFLDQRFKNLYLEDERFGEVYFIFSILAIFIASLGLYGLSSFMAHQRTKEVGVRKVLGASVPGVVLLFYKDFLILLLIAAVLGVPLIYYSMDLWLNNYAYRINFPWLYPFVAIIIVAIFALITVGYQIYKVAILSPAKTLKYE